MSVFNNIIVKTTELLPKSIVGYFAKKYIAGESLEQAVTLVKLLNSKNIFTTMDVLGESIKNKDEAIAAKNEALKVLDAIQKNNLKSNLSIKPTQMGLSISEDFAYSQVEELVVKAKEIGSFVRIDMEDSSTTDTTINLFKRLNQKYDNVGIVIQSYLMRSMNDIRELNKLGTDYRLCKGIYIESPAIAYKDKQKVRDNYLDLLKVILKDGNYVGIATHDDYLVEHAYQLINEMNIPKDKFEFQMLLGVKENLRDKINADGFKIRIYVPFGKDWYAYSIRRMKENPHIAGQIFKSIFHIS
ncbi:MAG TPA: proline dehydrogenase family protein [Ignavibacteriaceae bacterium]|nr:proline dehydrogenase family protein [Ignavibacteriaceae bacterium]